MSNKVGLIANEFDRNKGRVLCLGRVSLVTSILLTSGRGETTSSDQLFHAIIG